MKLYPWRAAVFEVLKLIPILEPHIEHSCFIGFGGSTHISRSGGGFSNPFARTLEITFVKFDSYGFAPLVNCRNQSPTLNP
jgi:hypothetical protein